MADPKQPEAEVQKSTDELLEERQSDATDDETLRGSEDRRGTLSSEGSDRDSAPSPDGALDESDEIDSAGPM